MIRLVLNVISVLLLSLIISCNNNSQKDSEKEQNTSKQEVKPDTVSDTVVVEVSVDKVSAWEDTCENDKYSIHYVEDFMKFRSNKQLENYFGKDKVKYVEEDYGAGWTANTSYVFTGYEKQITVCWQYVNDSTEKINFVTTGFRSYEVEELKPGGSKHTFKYGLKEGMSLEELVELNGQAVVFLSMAFSLGHQHSLGFVLNGYLRKEFQNYNIHIGYKLPKGTSNHPPDYTYLHTFHEISMGFSSDDPNLDITKLYVKSIEYVNNSNTP